MVLIINTLDEVEEKVGARLQKYLDEYNANSGRSYELATSFGLVSIGFENTTTIDEALKLADAAMYEHKRSRKLNRM